MEKETPDNRPEAVLDRVLERAGAVPPETPTEEWVQLEEIVLFVCETELSRVETALEVREKINALLSSHDAELRRKIEGMPIRSYNISATQIRQFVDRDAVLALLGTKK